MPCGRLMTAPETKTCAIGDANRRTGPVLALIAVVLNFLTVPMAISLWDTVFKERRIEAAFGFVFPLIGLLLLIWAIRKNLQLIVHGVSSFEIEGGRGLVGSELRGVVKNPRKTKFLGPVTVELQCIRNVTTGSGDSASSRRTAVWTGAQTFLPEVADLKMGLEVAIPIPVIAPPSNSSKPDSTVTWELHVNAPSSPVAFTARFIVPICSEL